MMTLAKISKSYAQYKAVDAASAAFHRGEVTAIIGPNGSGKSTLLAIATRLSAHDGGSVYLDQKLLASWKSSELAKQIAVLRQSQQINLRFTVKELVAFGRFPYSKGRLNADDHKKIQQALADLNLIALQDCYLDELSGGQQQLAFIAMVAAQDTAYIFLDEPLASLDIKHSLQIMKKLRILAKQRNKAIIIVIHDINFAACYADQMIALKQGRIVASGSVAEIMQAAVLETIYDTPFFIQEINGQRICIYQT